MSKKYTTDNITIDGILNDGVGAGTSGQVLSSTATGISWIDGSAIPGAGGTVTGTGGTNYVTKWSNTTGNLVNSLIYDNGTKVGIGTANPSEKLSIAGNMQMVGNSYIQGNNSQTSATGGYIVFTGNSGPAGYGAWVTQNAIWNGTNWIQPRGTLGSYLSTSNHHLAWTWAYVGASGTNGSVVTPVQTMLLDASGNLTTAGTLAVSGTGDSYFTGDLGVGVTSPGAKLHVQGNVVIGNTDGGYLQFLRKNGITVPSAASNTTRIGLDSALAGTVLYTSYGGSTGTVIFKGDGKVGIGTTIPQAHLDINTETAETTKVRINGEVNQQKRLEVRHYNASETGLENNMVFLASKSLSTATLGMVNASATDVDAISWDLAGEVTIDTNLTVNNNYVYKPFTHIENASPQYWLLCYNTGSNDINGQIIGDRTSGNWQAAHLDIVVSSDGTNMKGGTMTTHQVMQSSEEYQLVTLTRTSDTTSYVAIKYTGNTYPFTTEAYFSGMVKSSIGAGFLEALSTGVTNVVALTNSATKFTIGSEKVGIGTTNPGSKLQVDEYTVGANGSNTIFGKVSSFANSNTDNLYLGIKNAAYPNRGYGLRSISNGVNADFAIYEHGLSGERFRISILRSSKGRCS